MAVEQNPAQAFKNAEKGLMQETFFLKTGTTVVAGDEVFVSADNEVDLRNTASKTSYPFGIIIQAEDPTNTGKTLVRITGCTHKVKAIATGGALTAGGFVRPTGVRTAGVAQYAAAVTGDYASAIVVKGAAENAACVVYLLAGPVLVA